MIQSVTLMIITVPWAKIESTTQGNPFSSFGLEVCQKLQNFATILRIYNIYYNRSLHRCYMSSHDEARHNPQRYRSKLPNPTYPDHGRAAY